MGAARICMYPSLWTHMKNCDDHELSLGYLVNSGCQAVTHGSQTAIDLKDAASAYVQVMKLPHQLLKQDSHYYYELFYHMLFLEEQGSGCPARPDSTHQRALQWPASSFPSWSQLLRISLVCQQQHCLQQASEP